jgi:hypothetical protein
VNVRLIWEWMDRLCKGLSIPRNQGIYSILHKAESIWKKQPWAITTVHTNGTIRIQCETKSEKNNIRRVTPFSEEHLI